MQLNPKEVLSLNDARKLIWRAVEKTEETEQCGTFVVVDEGGNLMSASRMDGDGAFALPISRAKAYCAAVQRETSATISDRVSTRYLGIYLGYQEVSRDKMFPGQGAMLIEKSGEVIGSLSTGAGLGPFLKFDGIDPTHFIVDGEPANIEDLVICYALEVPYQSQHGDDMERWMNAYGKPPSEFGQGIGFNPAPPATNQPILISAIEIADAAIKAATDKEIAISVAVTDRCGDLIQIDRMDEAPPMTPDIAEAVAVTALNHQCPSREVGEIHKRYPEMKTVSDIVPFNNLAIPGGLPIYEGETIIGSIGISGATPDLCENIAETALPD